MRIILFFLFLLSAGRLAATAPVIGTTTFNNAFFATGNLLGATASPGTVTDAGNTSEPTGILPTGWDFTVTAPAATVTISATASGANPGGGADYCIRMNCTTGGVSVQTTAVKSNNASAFSLQSVYLKLNIIAGAPANMTITGYRSGVAVSGATATVNSIANQTWTLFDASSVSAFGNVDEFRFTQTGTSATISYEVVDQITIATAVALPLTLVDFGGRREDNTVRLQWSTASEQNTAFFEVQRGINGEDFTAAGRVEAAGNSTQTLHYVYTDLPPSTSSAWLYRLKLADLDGRFTYSPVLKINNTAAGPAFAAYPNPFRQQLAITVETGEAGKAQMDIRDMNGKLLLRQDFLLQKGRNGFSLPFMERLGKGVYFLRLTTSQEQRTIRVLKLG
jgi:hypothetical protein